MIMMPPTNDQERTARRLLPRRRRSLGLRCAVILFVLFAVSGERWLHISAVIAFFSLDAVYSEGDKLSCKKKSFFLMVRDLMIDLVMIDLVMIDLVMIDLVMIDFSWSVLV
jgi:hypothetical protein